MTKWTHTVKIRHFFTHEEDYESIKQSMKNIADEVKKHDCFKYFSVSEFYKIPKGDNIFKPVDYANALISRLYDYADANRIWID